MEYFTDVSSAERAEILNFCNYVKTQMPIETLANGGTVNGDFVDFIIGGSFANGTADALSDYDIFLVMDRHDAFVTPNNPSLIRRLLRKLIRVDQQNFELSRYIDGVPMAAWQYIDYPQNAIFGVSLLTNTIYNNTAELNNAFPRI